MQVRVKYYTSLPITPAVTFFSELKEVPQYSGKIYEEKKDSPPKSWVTCPIAADNYACDAEADFEDSKHKHCNISLCDYQGSAFSIIVTKTYQDVAFLCN